MWLLRCYPGLFERERCVFIVYPSSPLSSEGLLVQSHACSPSCSLSGRCRPEAGYWARTLHAKGPVSEAPSWTCSSMSSFRHFHLTFHHPRSSFLIYPLLPPTSAPTIAHCPQPFPSHTPPASRLIIVFSYTCYYVQRSDNLFLLIYTTPYPTLVGPFYTFARYPYLAPYSSGITTITIAK